MIIEELKTFLRATILISTDMNKKEFALELLEKIIAMEQKIAASKDIYIESPLPKLSPGVIVNTKDGVKKYELGKDAVDLSSEL